MDITAEYYLEQIAKSKNKRNWRIRNFIHHINLLISEYRLTSRQFKGSYVAGFCSHEANVLESRLNRSLGE